MTDEEKQQCSVPGCDFNETGVCGVHKYEVERRRDTEKAAKTREARVQKIDLKMNWILGILFVYGLVNSGSFTYTKFVDEDSVSADASLKQEITTVVKTVHTLANTVNTLATAMAVHQATSEGKQALMEKEIENIKLISPFNSWSISPGGPE